MGPIGLILVIRVHFYVIKYETINSVNPNHNYGLLKHKIDLMNLMDLIFSLKYFYASKYVITSYCNPGLRHGFCNTTFESMYLTESQL